MTNRRPARPGDDARLRELDTEVQLLRAELERASLDANAVHPAHEQSAANLAHFLALRSRDRRALQDGLAEYGLSSLGRCESHVLTAVTAVARAVAALRGTHCGAEQDSGNAPGFFGGRQLLDRNAHDLLGPPPLHRWTRIMVTLPSDAAADSTLAEQFVAAGMNVARINCAHDDPQAWRQMVANVRAASARMGRPVRVVMDLAGPKLRTTGIPDGPAVLRLRPQRDVFGRVVEPARAVLVARSTDTRQAQDVLAGEPPTVHVPPDLLTGLLSGDTLTMLDTRGARRRLLVVHADAHRAVVEAVHTVYVTNGSELHGVDGRCGTIDGIPNTPGAVVLCVGDEVWLMAAGVDAPLDATALRVECTLPEAIDALAPRHRVYFDDGRVGGTVVRTVPHGALVRVTSARPGGVRLRNEKGVNLPDTEIPLPALTAADREALDTVVDIADAVAMSFVRQPRDVAELRAALAERGAEDLGIVLKIETLPAFGHLPELVLEAMASRRVGVMIARGDLAVEVGYERLAEVQEEILWLCEAAHLPVIWATQVLDMLARTGQPSRAEITDAAMSERADCVMLNKGPHITQAIATLDDILVRMAGHQSKKRPLLRPLRSWIRE